jgi:ketosteroid isomerase-like protein
VSNIATVQGIYEAFGKGDVPAIQAVLADDVEWESWPDNSSVKAGVPWMVPRNGKDDVVHFFEAVAQMEVVEVQVLGMMEGGNKVAVEFVIEAKVPSSGKQFRDEEIHVWTFDDKGKVTRLRHYTDTAKQIAVFQG